MGISTNPLKDTRTENREANQNMILEFYVISLPRSMAWHILTVHQSLHCHMLTFVLSTPYLYLFSNHISEQRNSKTFHKPDTSLHVYEQEQCLPLNLSSTRKNKRGRCTTTSQKSRRKNRRTRSGYTMCMQNSMRTGCLGLKTNT